MTIRSCLDEAVRANRLTNEQRQDILNRYKAISDRVGEMMAKNMLIQDLETAGQNKRRVALMAEARRKALLQEINEYTNAKGERDPVEGFRSMFENMGRFNSYISDIQYDRMSIVTEKMGKLDALLQEFIRGPITGDFKRRLNRKTAASLANVVDELFKPGSTGDAKAAALAKAWSEIAEELRQEFNAAGGNIGKLDKWGLPQWHDPRKVGEATASEWVNFIMPLLDRDRMVDQYSGRPFTDEELISVLHDVHHTIVTEGMSKTEPTSQPQGRGALWKQHADHRFLHFKNGETWRTYANKFGQPDAFLTMMSHIQVMARDIAHMRKFGPNPNAMVTYLSNHLMHQAAKVLPTEKMIEDHHARLKEFGKSITQPNPEFTKLLDREAEILRELNRNRHSMSAVLSTSSSVFRKEPGPRGTQYRETMDALATELLDVIGKIEDMRNRSAEFVDDPRMLQAFQDELDKVVLPILFANRPNPVDYTRGTLYRINKIWEHQRGSMNMPVNEGLAAAMSSLRNLVSSTALGGAGISSLTDAAFGQDARIRMGMGFKANFVRTMAMSWRHMLSQTITPDLRRKAVRARLGLESAMHILHMDSRLAGMYNTRTITGFLTDRTLTWGLLLPLTQASKHAFGLDVMGFFADIKGQDFGSLPGNTRDMLTWGGIKQADWDIVRTAAEVDGLIRPQEIEDAALPIYQQRLQGVTDPAQIATIAGNDFANRVELGVIKIEDIPAELARDLARRYHTLILRATTAAVPESTAASHALSNVGQPGTVPREFLNTVLQFKSFPISILYLFAGDTYRAVLARGGYQPWAQAAALLITGTVIGAFVVGLKDIAAGRDPRPWVDENSPIYADPKFWAAAMLQGGGLGIFGDFLFSDVNRFGSGLTRTTSGPLIDRAGNVIGLGQYLATGQLDKAGKKAVKVLDENSPVVGTIFWTALLWQRLVIDQLEFMANANAYSEFRNDVRRRQREYRQDFWFAPGETSAQRGPDLSRIGATR